MLALVFTELISSPKSVDSNPRPAAVAVNGSGIMTRARLDVAHRYVAIAVASMLSMVIAAVASVAVVVTRSTGEWPPR